MIDSAGAVYYYLNDHLGSAAVVINSSGTVRDKHKYQAFGGSDGSSVVLGQAYRYTGKPLDEELDLDWYYYGARYYDPSIGRFLTVDPARAKYAYLGPYVYVANNPLKFFDPHGEDIAIAIDHGAALQKGHVFMFIGTDEAGWTSVSFDMKYTRNWLIDFANLLGVIGGAFVPGEVTIETKQFENMTLQQILDEGIATSPDYLADEVTVIKTTSEQDALALELARKLQANPSDYMLYWNNCADVAFQILVYAGVKGVNTDIVDVPNWVFPKNMGLGENKYAKDWLAQLRHWAAQARAERQAMDKWKRQQGDEVQ